MNSYMNAMRRYVDFSGRSSRSEFWFFVLFYFIIAIIATVIDAVVLGSQMAQGVGILSGIAMLVHLIPSIAVAIRRLHDTDRSGWWILIGLIPLIGLIWLIVLYCMESTGPNRFGAQPT